jgi:hypothetical protein
MTENTIRVHADSEDAMRYQELLDSDWSREILEGVLALLRKLIAHGAKPDAIPWQKVLIFGPHKKSEREFDSTILSRLRDLARAFEEPALPAMPDQFTAIRPSRIAAQAEQAWAYLIIQSMARLRGSKELFRDTQSLLFLCSAHYLLPQLQNHGLTAEHDCLACAMYVHTLLVWRTQPAHLLHLQSILMDCLGDRQRRLDLLNMSFRLTAPHDHSYLTRATAYWSELMELHKYEEAADFLFLLTKQAPDSCQEEIQEMLSETYVEANGAVSR